MRNSITGYSIANEIMMSNYKGNYLLVEGDSDLKLFEKMIDSNYCKIKEPQSQNNVIKAIEVLENNKFDRAIGIIDADFFLLDGNPPNSSFLFLTDTHDLETTILKSDAFRNVIDEYCCKEKLYGFEKVHKKNLIDILLENGKLVGFFRWYCKKNNIRLKFRDFPLIKCMDNSFSIEPNKMIFEITKNSQFSSTIIDENKLISEINANPQVDLWLVCNGHDLIYILLIWLQKKIGKNSRLRNIKNMKKGDLETIFRLAFEKRYFENTNLYLRIKNWQLNSNKIIFS